MAYSVLVTVREETLEEVVQSGPDGVVVDLADTAGDPAGTRGWLQAALPGLREAGLTVVARVNHPRTGMLRDDLDAAVQPGLDAVILPHVTEPQDIRDLAVLLREFELPRELEPGDVAVFPAVDTARGLLRAAELANLLPRVAGLAFDATRYAAHIGARAEEWGPRLAYARGMCVAAARAADGLPIVIGQGTECRQLAHYGFAGILLPGPAQVAAAIAAFRPSAAEVQKAREVVATYETARTAGATVARQGTTLVDGSDARRARQVIEASSGEGD